MRLPVVGIKTEPTTYEEVRTLDRELSKKHNDFIRPYYPCEISPVSWRDLALSFEAFYYGLRLDSLEELREWVSRHELGSVCVSFWG